MGGRKFLSQAYGKIKPVVLSMTALAKASVVFGYVCTLPFFGFQIKTHHLMGIILHWFNLPTDLELKLIRICFHFPDGNFRMTEVGHAMEHYISMAMPS